MFNSHTDMLLMIQSISVSVFFIEIYPDKADGRHGGLIIVVSLERR